MWAGKVAKDTDQMELKNSLEITKKQKIRDFEVCFRMIV